MYQSHVLEANDTRTEGERYVHVKDGTRLFVRSWGSGRPMVFVHGWALQSDSWQYAMAHVCENGFRAITYDRRGHGRSADSGSGYDYDTLADDLATILESLDIRDAVLVGHSMGAGEITRYLTRHGDERIGRVVFIAPSTPFNLKTADNPGGVIDRQHLEVMRDQLKRDWPGWLAENAAPFFVTETSRGMMEWTIQLCRQTSLKALLDSNLADVATDFRGELPDIRKPVLVIHGDKDVSAPLHANGKGTAELIPNAKLVIYEGGPHGLFLTHMDRLHRDIVEFATM